MGKILDEPKYAVVDKAPSFSKIVGNFSIEDLTIWAATTGVCVPLGYLAGAHRSPAFAKVSGAMGRPSMWVGGVMGFTAGFMLAYQNSSGRLLGLLPNESEVREHGRL